MKKLFVLFLCLVAVAGFVSADDYRPPGALALELPGYGVGYEAVTPDTVLTVTPLIVAEPVSFQSLCQRQEGLLNANDFKTPVMGALAEKTRKKVDRLLMCRELKLGIQRPISVALDDYLLRI